MKNSLLILMLFLSFHIFAGSIKSVEVSTKETQKERKVNKLLHSKFAKSLVKKAYIRKKNSELRKQLNDFQGTKAEKRAYKKEQKKVIREDAQKKLSGNTRTGAILIIIGLIATLVLTSELAWLGVIAIVVGLIFILLDLL